jgi:hypothetical protein
MRVIMVNRVQRMLRPGSLAHVIAGGGNAILTGMLMLHPLPAQSRVATLLAKRELFISPDAADLSRVGNLAVGPHGEIAIGQPEDGTVLVFSASGAKRVLGRTGAGPGEFRLPGPVQWVGDTLVVPDRVVGRVTAFSDQGVLLGSRRLPVDYPLATTPDGATVRLVDAFLARVYGDGAYLARSQWQIRTSNGGRNLQGVVKLDANGRLQRIVAKESDDRPCNFGKGGRSIQIPFCEPETRAFADDGTWIVYALAIGDNIGNVRARVTAIDSAGDTVFTRELPVPARALPRAFADSVLAFRISHTSRPDNVPLYRAMKLREYFPPLLGLVVGRDRSVWLELDTVGGGHLWWVLDATGRHVGTLLLPGSAILQVADRDQIWTLEEDESGLQGVARYRIARTSP